MPKSPAKLSKPVTALKKTGESQAKKQKLEKAQQAEKAKQALSIKKHKQALQKQVREHKNLEKKVLGSIKPAPILTKYHVDEPVPDKLTYPVVDKVAAGNATQLARDVKMLQRHAIETEKALKA